MTWLRFGHRGCDFKGVSRRTFTGTRESIAIEVGQRLKGKDVASVFDRIGNGRRFPKTIRVDNGPEFTLKALDKRLRSGFVRGFCLG